jgi:sphingomyelin phosphodiesterase 4
MFLALQVVCFLSTIKQAHLTSTSLVEALEKRRTGRRFLISLWEFFNGDDTSSDDISLEERKRVPIFLANAQQQLIEIFQVGQVLTPNNTHSRKLISR